MDSDYRFSLFFCLLVQLEGFIQQNEKHLLRAKLGLDQAVERVKLNVNWHHKYYQRISSLLAEISD